MVALPLLLAKKALVVLLMQLALIIFFACVMLISLISYNGGFCVITNLILLIKDVVPLPELV